MIIARYAKTEIAKLLARNGLEIRRVSGPPGTSRGYISAEDTVSAAQRQGLSLCEYVETLWGQPGSTRHVIDRMAASGIFAPTPSHVLEIGPGTGRYLEQVLNRCRPVRYESYETASDWADWLSRNYPIVSQPADGVSLSHTRDLSIDLVHAHGVFVYLPFLVAYRYWIEIWRVTRETGSVVFDIISEKCMDEKTVDAWIRSGNTYPSFISTGYVVTLFERHGFSLVHSFLNRYGEGHSEYLVFSRSSKPPA